MDYKRSIQEAESVLNHALEEIQFWIGEEVDGMVQKFDRENASAMNRFCEVDDRNLALTKRMSFRLMDLEVKDKTHKLKRLKAAF
jgi:hypothetical protein